MERFLGKWLIRTEDEFLRKCDPAPEMIDRVRAHAAANDKQWFFGKAYADWEEGQILAEFTSYQTPEYENHRLSITATKGPNGEWIISNPLERTK